MPVYIARSHDGKRAKIGWSGNPKRRVASLVCCPQVIKFDLLRVIAGSIRTERWLQWWFRNNRMLDPWGNQSQDWFSWHPEMMTVRPPRTIEQLELELGQQCDYPWAFALQHPHKAAGMRKPRGPTQAQNTARIQRMKENYRTQAAE